MKREQSFLKGALLLSAGNFSAKVIGAAARIPLTALLGAEGIGLYQLAYPFYCLLLALSSSGLTSGISKMTAEEVERGGSGEGVLRGGVRLFTLIGVVFSLAMAILGGSISQLQGQGESLTVGYWLLSPSVAAVCLLSLFRGWFQGRKNMLPSAVTEGIEQLVKGAVSILFAYLLLGDRVKAVSGVLFSVTLSELCALGYIYLAYRRERGCIPLYAPVPPSNQAILKVTLPVAIAAAILPLSQVIDGNLCVRLLSGEEAVASYGLYAGGAVTLVSLPVSVCYGLAMAVIPRMVHGGKNVQKSLLATLVVAVPCAFILFFFARPLGALFFQRLTKERLDLLEKLVKVMAPTAITHACVQTLAGCLIGRGKAVAAARNMAIGVGVKILVALLLLPREKIGVFGLAIGANGCYFTVFVLNLIENIAAERGKKKEERKQYDHGRRIGCGRRRSNEKG